MSKVTSIPVKYIDKNNTLEECGINSSSFNELIYYINNRYSINIENYLLDITNSLEEVISIIHESVSNRKEDITPFNKENRKLLKQISYIFHSGRDAMKYRLAIVAKDCRELKEKLSSYIDGTKNIDGIYCEGDNLTLQKDSKYDEAALNWVESGKVEDWESLYNEEIPQKISLPSYPFNHKRYWVDEKKIEPNNNNDNISKEVAVSNVVKKNKKLYKKNLNKDLFYLRDHKVNGKHVLPGVMYL